ncbi:MAG TPA: hypothetical protein VEK07_25880 [Polyangiaceae bacterium]|nr:hypothetical protein [Polyangiaceae bacterium]
MRRCSFLARFVAALLAASIPAIARAEPSDADRATARALAREGYEAEKRGQYGIAADRFGRAEALVHAPTLLLGLARAQTGLGKLVEAQEIYERIIREPLAPNAPPPFEKAVEDAKSERAALIPRIAWVTIVVSGAASPDVVLDDAPMLAATLGVRRACNPGEHSVKATAKGFAPAERTFIVGEGSEQMISIPMEALPPATPEPVAAAVVTAKRPAPGMPLQTELAIGALGVGAVGLITGGAAGIWVLARHASLSSACPQGQCGPSESSALNTYRAVADLSTAALIVGGVGAAAGVALVLTTPKGAPITAYAGLLGAGVEGRF